MEKSKLYQKRIFEGMKSGKLFRIPSGTPAHSSLDFIITKKGKHEFKRKGSVSAKEVRFEIWGKRSPIIRAVRFR